MLDKKCLKRAYELYNIHKAFLGTFFPNRLLKAATLDFYALLPGIVALPYAAIFYTDTLALPQ